MIGLNSFLKLNTVDLKCVSLGVPFNDSVIFQFRHICVYSFSDSFLMGYNEILRLVLCAIQ